MSDLETIEWIIGDIHKIVVHSTDVKYIVSSYLDHLAKVDVGNVKSIFVS